MVLKTLFSNKRVKSLHYETEDIEKRNADDPLIQPQNRLMTRLLLDKRIPPIPTDEERIEFPFRKTNIFSETFFTWCVPLLETGYRRTVQPQDLYKISKGSDFDVEKNSDIFLAHFHQLKSNCESKYMKKHNIEDTPENREGLLTDENFKYPSNLVLLALYKTYFYNYTFAVLCKAVADVGAALNSLQIKALINYVQRKAEGQDVGKKGYGLAVGISCIVFFFGILYARNFNDASFTGAEIKGVLTKVLLDKSFRLDRESRAKFPPSTITAYLGNDLSKIDLATNFFPFVICLPIGLGITIALLAVNLGGASLSGVAWFILITICIVFSTKFLMRWRKSINVETDARVKCIKEVLNNIKMIKYYAWEKPFTKLISKLRNKEMTIMLKNQVFRNFITGIAVTLPTVSALIGFLSMYGQFGGLKNASKIFSSVTLFNILTAHVAMLPTALTSASDAWIAFSRVQNFLLATETKKDPNYNKYPQDSSKTAISIKNGIFDWLSDPENYTPSISTDESTENKLSSGSLTITGNDLSNINLNITQGEFLVITGSIGSGKSSLLAAINGDMPRLDGNVDIYGDLILCSNPWIQNTTVRENITFGLDYDKQIYKTVIESCSLTSDFEILPAGDMTEIGERGVNLSGGQKARINLARTVYRAYIMDEYNIVMFDDVLSAVDAKVGKHIMSECILGLLGNKTRVLATHQLSLIGDADRIIYMNGDGTIDIGTNEELIARNPGFKNLMDFQMEGEDEKEDEANDEDEVEDEDAKAEELKLIRKQTTVVDQEKGRLITTEVSKTNGIPLDVMVTYLRSGCGKVGLKFMLPNLILSITFTAFCMLFTNVWLSFWSSDRFSDRSDGFYIGIYVMITIMFVLCAIWQFCTIIFITNRSSTMLNIKAVNNIMHAPMAFFDTTPMGRIINRFTKDTDVLDNEIAEQTRLCCFGFGNMCGIIIMCCIFLPWFTIAVPILGVYVTCCFNYYQSTAREVKRIESTSRSLVFSSFDEVLQGLATIKLYSSDERFINKNTRLINTMNEAYFYTIGVQRWFAMALHGVSASVNLIVGMLSASRAYPISAASSGLLISYIVQLSMQLISFSKSLGQVEQYSSSIERICEYATELPQEAPYEKDIDQTLPPSWPEHGKIQFKDVSLKYRPELPFVLKNMNLDIKPNEKIGICGRTGAGKSTIMTALYRLSEIECGEMTIDGVNISEIGLFKLRSKLAIIPQDPVLFKGTIRSNLDPFEETDEYVLQNALDLACGTENSEKFSLDSIVEEDGTNYSLGERQVIALCRALIRESKILILDEATSSVDYETDARIQNTIAQGFKDCTILCIAHRLRTILNYDRILVMDKGECAEFDTPKALWQNKEGIFRSMCEKSGIEEMDFE
ncbi:hypothetical protein DAPK24_008990 [Pichia kluyveri]|uniref:Oligomycin resistance ATP-dependent permease YOR1 n=1 Tax=Pichia kluyveri TaxID=36015 RepID=A0AAV5QYR6_PICKL|nr:hypothetical protein DAPK24_008990 [Pichia kluyveri]